MASFDPAYPADSVRNRGLSSESRPEAEFVVSTHTGDLFVKGDSFEIDGHIVIIRDRAGKQVAAFKEWLGVRVKETV